MLPFFFLQVIWAIGLGMILLAALLRGLLGGGPSVDSGAPAAAMGVGGIALLHGGQLQLSLTRLQLGELNGMGEASVELAPIVRDSGERNVLHELKDTTVGAALGETDSATLDIVAMLFDEIFDDDHIPEALKSLMGRLQLPILKVALADKQLFSDKAHPARQLIDVLGRVGLRLPADFDKSSPLFARLKAFIEELVEGFREKLDIFDEVRARLEGLVAEEEARIAKVNEAPRREMDEAEALALAKAAAENRELFVGTVKALAAAIDGKDVAVKVLRPGIREQFARDIETYEWAAAHLEAV